MPEVQTGVWHWQAGHPEWEHNDGWDRIVSSYAIDDGERLLLFDPLEMPAEVRALAADRSVVIVLTCPWHERDARKLAQRFNATIYVPPAEEADPDPVPGQTFAAGDQLPVGVRAYPGMEPNDLVLWVESRRAVIVGDTLIDRGEGLMFPLDWAQRVGQPDQILDSLQHLADLPVEMVLPTHGTPTDAAALRRAIA